MRAAPQIKQIKPRWAQQQERGSVVALKLMTWIALHLGRSISRLILLPIVAYFLIASPKARATSRQFLSRIPQQRTGWLSLYRHLFAFAAVTLDRIYFLNGRMELFDIDIKDVNNSALTAASSGAGLFLMGAHLGSFESIRSIARDYPQLKMVLLMYEDHALKIKQQLASINPEAQQDIIALGRPGAMLQVRAQLGDGALIGLLGDRTLDEHGNVQVPFLGSTATFPLGPFRMAAMLRHPAYFMVGLYQGGNRYTVHLEPIMDFSSSTDKPEFAAQAALERYVQLIEQYCKLAPYNWFNFFDFWQESRTDTHENP
jgi:predicted LPLAT superfamily acyltransferase